MNHDQNITLDEQSVKIDEWFSEEYKESDKSLTEIQLLILYKLHQLEERLKVVEYQTKSHWAN